MTVEVDRSYENARRAAARAALNAWRAIAHYYDGDCTVTDKPEGPCTDADRLADRLIVEELRSQFPPPQYGYLSEEAEADPARLEATRVWIIDPIDGTKEFIKHTGNFAIQIGLVERQPDGAFLPVAAAVFQPTEWRLDTAVRGEGAWRTIVEPQAVEPDLATRGEPLHVSAHRTLHDARALLGRVNQTSRTMRLMRRMGIHNVEELGSLGVKLSQMAAGGNEFYVNMGWGKAKEWDTCAPALILAEAGGIMTDLFGLPLQFNQPDYYHRHGLLASNGLLHDALLAEIGAFLKLEETAPPRPRA